MNNIPSVVTPRKKRVGRGVGSGKGFHTTGRGQKGQGARRNIGILFEGVKTKKSLLHRLPMLSGKGRNKGAVKPLAINVLTLETLNGDVTLESLLKANIIRKSDAARGVKILGTGKLTKKLNVSVPASKSAREAIIAAGGTIA